ncbi:hypothetical protein CYMTET_26994 [Cymbomonas tetramitiformis]|uniref:Major facilitator superfamily (MFS) profile domain-containing protein n=1 Tax=Cymbomonas tetramitiformis TaxID=36881 RepID=A0AAE0FQN5_9CHLO|nr:hypothetical protein CYMTET_26994 [Cymbomonas tetramitiformis]
MALEHIGGKPQPDNTASGILLIGLGWYQTRTLLLLGGLWIVTVWPVFIPVFAHSAIDYECDASGATVVLEAPQASSSPKPSEEQAEAPNGSFEEDDGAAAMFLGDFGRGTIASEFNLVCDRKPHLAIVGSVFFLGCFFGAAFGGRITDTLGRYGSNDPLSRF